MLKIGYRTLKTAIGTGISIFIAEWLGLQFYAAAGILTILCIGVTRKRSYSAAINRILSCLLGIILGCLFFAVLSFHPYTITLYLLVFLPIIVRLGINEGFVSSAVILLHIYSLERISLDVLGNELALLGIGIGVALVMNLYMPGAEKELLRLREAVQQNYKTIFKEFCFYLRNGTSDWDGKEMIETEKLLERAIHLSLQDLENRLRKKEDSFYQYFVMRKKQFELLERMLPIVSTLHARVPEGERIADFLEELANSVHSGNTAYLFLDKLQQMRDDLRKFPLPKTQEEFEIRAALFNLMHEIEEYLFVKHNLAKSDQSRRSTRQAGG